MWIIFPQSYYQGHICNSQGHKEKSGFCFSISVYFVLITKSDFAKRIMCPYEGLTFAALLFD